MKFCYDTSFTLPKQSQNSRSRFFFLFQVPKDLEKSLKMTLVLENSWNCKKVQFVLELSLNLKKNFLGNHKKFLKMIETVFLDVVHNKNQENCKIGNRKRSAVPYSAVVPPWYSILFDSSSTNQMQLEVKPCKAEIGERQKTKVAC